MRYILLLALAIVFAGCGDDGVPIPFGEPDVEPATAAQIDSLAAEGAHASISGTVLEQDGRHVMVDDGTGLIRIILPDEPPLMTGHRFLASGRLIDENGDPVLQATEWLYDSTAVPVHSD